MHWWDPLSAVFLPHCRTFSTLLNLNLLTPISSSGTHLANINAVWNYYSWKTFSGMWNSFLCFYSFFFFFLIGINQGNCWYCTLGKGKHFILHDHWQEGTYAIVVYVIVMRIVINTWSCWLCNMPEITLLENYVYYSLQLEIQYIKTNVVLLCLMQLVIWQDRYNFPYISVPPSNSVPE